MLLQKHYADRILTEEQGRNELESGWLAADLHVHTSCSHDVLPTPEFHPEAIYQNARQKGLHYITFTDHDTMDAYDIIGWERENLVTGVEMTLLDPIRVGHTIHINVYELNKPQFYELKRITQLDRNIETFIDFCKDQDLPFTYNHPFWFVGKEKPEYQAVEDTIQRFPVIEYNMKRVRRKNMMAIWLASKYNKGMTASTDTHIGKIGEAYTLSKGNTFREYFQYIAGGKAKIVPQDLNLTNLNEEIAVWIDLLFNLHECNGDVDHFTGMKVLDRGIIYLSNRTSLDHPRVFQFLEFFLNQVARTRFFPAFYLFSQNLSARKICKLLEIPDLA